MTGNFSQAISRHFVANGTAGTATVGSHVSSYSLGFDRNMSLAMSVLQRRSHRIALADGQINWAVHAVQCAPFYIWESGDGEEEAGSSSVVEGRREGLKGSGESEAFGAAGGKEAAADAQRGGAEGDGVGCQV
jgi:hypothetical protein